MTIYKLTVNLDATLAVQNLNGSFNYFKPSIGAEITVDETDDLTVLGQKFEGLFAEVIGPNFDSIVKEFLINSNNVEENSVEDTGEEVESGKPCDCTDGSCSCKTLEIRTGPVAGLDNEVLPREEWE